MENARPGPWRFAHKTPPLTAAQPTLGLRQSSGR